PHHVGLGCHVADAAVPGAREPRDEPDEREPAGLTVHDHEDPADERLADPGDRAVLLDRAQPHHELARRPPGEALEDHDDEQVPAPEQRRGPHVHAVGEVDAVVHVGEVDAEAVELVQVPVAELAAADGQPVLLEVLEARAEEEQRRHREEEHVDQEGGDPAPEHGGGVTPGDGHGGRGSSGVRDGHRRVSTTASRSSPASGCGREPLRGRPVASAVMSATPQPDPTLFDKIVNLSKRRGFVFPSAEIYGGFRSTYDYGPLGVLLLRNVKDAWWRSVVQMRRDVVGIDASILSPPAVWEASGHLANFTDPL